MARLVKRDTFLYEDAGGGNLVRRQVFAGQFAPDHYVEGEDTASGAFEEAEGPQTYGFGAAPADYKHNRSVDAQEQLKRRGRKASAKEAQALAQGGQAAVDAARESKNVDAAQVSNAEQDQPSNTLPQ